MKKRVIMYNIFTAIIILCTSVYAVANADLDLKMSSNNLHAGDTFEITLSLKDIQDIDGVDGINGYINIDKNVLESIGYSSIVKDSDNKVTIKGDKYKVVDVNNNDDIVSEGVLFNNQVANNDCVIVISLKKKVTTDDILKIRFKIKDNVKPGTYTDAIKYELFTLTSGVSYQSQEITKKISLTVVEKPNNTVNNVTNEYNIVNITNEPKNNTNTENPGASGNTNNKTNIPNGVGNKVNNVVNNKVNNVNNQVGASKSGTTNSGTGKYENGSSSSGTTSTTNAGAKTTSSASDATVKSGGLPAAGTTQIIIRIAALGSVLGYIIYRKYTKYKDI